MMKLMITYKLMIKLMISIRSDKTDIDNMKNHSIMLLEKKLCVPGMQFP